MLPRTCQVVLGNIECWPLSNQYGKQYCARVDQVYAAQKSLLVLHHSETNKFWGEAKMKSCRVQISRSCLQHPIRRRLTAVLWISRPMITMDWAWPKENLSNHGLSLDVTMGLAFQKLSSFGLSPKSVVRVHVGLSFPIFPVASTFLASVIAYCCRCPALSATGGVLSMAVSSIHPHTALKTVSRQGMIKVQR